LRSRNILILGICQALGLAGAPLVLLIGGIVGRELAPAPAWATLPISITMVGVAAFSIPAALLMKRIGRRLGFMAGAAVAALAALGAAYAIAVASFALFCGAMIFMGANMAFVQQYRFAAAESVDSRHTGRAIALVLLGGVAAGWIGPEIGNRAKDWLAYGVYTGSFVSLAGVYVAVALLLSLLRDGAPQEESAGGAARPLAAVVTQPTYLVATLANMVAYGVMSLIMTATPISMHVMDGHSLGQTTRVIQGHITAMFLPALFTGLLAERLGVLRVMAAGVTAMGLTLALALSGRGVVHYGAALVLLGLGWNLLFVGGTTLLTRSYRPAERFQAQAASDFLTFGAQVLASLSAGAVLSLASWELLNLMALPLLLAMLGAIVWLRRQMARPAALPAAAAAE
jgi:MFS family permease